LLYKPVACITILLTDDGSRTAETFLELKDSLYFYESFQPSCSQDHLLPGYN